MSDITERQFQEADAAIQRGVTDFMSRIERLIVKCEAVAPAVAPAYIVERLALALCAELSKLIDKSKLDAGDATLALSNALADYRDSRSVESNGRTGPK